MERIAVAMSGGVDSSVAAALLKKQGYEVIGITMRLPLCGRKGIGDARRVARKLGIRHYTLDLKKAVEKKVIREFIKEYLKGRTPNPCVRCNQLIKFGALLKKALSLGAGSLATGHYARLSMHQASGARYRVLKKAKDRKKDQSYFLYRLRRGQLEHILFPLGDYTKQEIREIAEESGLPVADKPDSQEICFLRGRDYRGFLRSNVKKAIKPGEIVDSDNKVLGKHKGIPFYTIGQREGLGLAKGYPVYVTKIEAKNNRITVGGLKEAYAREFLVKDLNLAAPPAKKRVALKVRIRYNHPEAEARVEFFGHKARVLFKAPQFAVTPGQSAVFYRKGLVLGGGIIERILR